MGVENGIVHWGERRDFSPKVLLGLKYQTKNVESARWQRVRTGLLVEAVRSVVPGAEALAVVHDDGCQLVARVSGAFCARAHGAVAAHVQLRREAHVRADLTPVVPPAPPVHG